MKHYAVIGRIPYDDEDSCLTYANVPEDDAIQMFEQDIYESAGRKDAEQVRKREGQAVYITRVLSSDSPIEIVQ